MSMEKRGVVDAENTPPENTPQDAATREKQGSVDTTKLSEHTAQRLADSAAGKPQTK